MGREYKAPKNLNASIGSERYEWVESRAELVSEMSGLNPKKSDVIGVAIDCYKEVLAQFGENWRDQLKVQSEPLYAKDLRNQLTEILNLIEALPTRTLDEQKEVIAEIRNSIQVDTAGVLE